ncbi:retroviral-like aspartic protease family protein [Sphingomonas sp. AP4-R1]|uniref:retropepsin-like aspartic protease family protein n=1 Tax=Sphingomonas sp. AP4-R1 TaxID=2735134 RepID=UPI0014939958|nr:retropepsin-like aspartic protease [Sphingomonas sp. AP4-R1]QJU60240.1 retroviral-like aspartic protease family protein [Sphingomonas sp. AP4-R1]
MAAHFGVLAISLASLLTAGLPTAYALGSTRPGQSIGVITPDLALTPSVDSSHLLRSADGFFYAVASVDGRQVRLLIDTGASAIMLSTAEARRMGVDVDKLTFDQRVITSAGTVAMSRAVLDHMDVAGRTFEDVTVMVMPANSGIGLMGQSMLSRFDLVSIEGDTLKLR